MNRLKYLACALAVAAAGCGSSTNSLTTPSTNNNVQIDFTDSINGPLTKNGAQTFQFATLATGTITATLVALLPDGPNLQAVGMSLGVPDSTGGCQRVVSNDHLLQSTSVNATATAIGTFCVSIYDSTGTLPGPQTFDIQISHP
jgi:hypothetical protein